MIGLIFELADETVEVRIAGASVYFRTSQFDRWATIDGLNLSKHGCIIEFPDLKDREDWKEESIRRFKEKIKNMKNDEEISEYILNDLKNHGYKPLFKQKQGFRPEKL